MDKSDGQAETLAEAWKQAEARVTDLRQRRKAMARELRLLERELREAVTEEAVLSRLMLRYEP